MKYYINIFRLYIIFRVSLLVLYLPCMESYKAVTCRLSKWLVSPNQPTTLVTMLVTRMFVIMLVTSLVFFQCSTVWTMVKFPEGQRIAEQTAVRVNTVHASVNVIGSRSRRGIASIAESAAPQLFTNRTRWMWIMALIVFGF